MKASQKIFGKPAFFKGTFRYKKSMQLAFFKAIIQFCTTVEFA